MDIYEPQLFLQGQIPDNPADWTIHTVINVYTLLIYPHLKEKYPTARIKFVDIYREIPQVYRENEAVTETVKLLEHQKRVSESIRIYYNSEDIESPLIQLCYEEYNYQFMVTALALPFIYEPILGKNFLTEEEKQVFAALADDNTAPLKALLEPHLKKLREAEEGNALNELVNHQREEKIAKLRHQIADFRKLYVKTAETLRQYAMEIQDDETTLAALEQTSEIQTDELLNSLHQMKMNICKTDNHNYDISCLTHLTNYDMDIAETRIIGREEKYFFSEETKILRSLMKAIFIDRKYKVRIFQQYGWNSVMGSITGNSEMISKEKSAIANPHISHYDCFGAGRKELLADLLLHNDWEGFFAEIQAVTSCISFTDASARDFLEDILDNREEKFIEDKEGNIWTPNEIMKKLKAETEE